ncbi:Toxin HigB-2 [compost metagenome]
MESVFVELPPFQRYRTDYLDDEAFRSLQSVPMKNPEAGDVIQGTGGLRKMRFGDGIRHRGKRGGIRIIYDWWQGGTQFWLFTLYGKDEQSDLSADQRKALRRLLEWEGAARIHNETRHFF